MITIDKDDLIKYISSRERELKQHVMGLSMDEKQTTLLRGGYKELQLLRRAIEIGLANPQEGRNV